MKMRFGESWTDDSASTIGESDARKLESADFSGLVFSENEVTYGFKETK